LQRTPRPPHLERFFAPAAITPQIGKVIRVMIGIEVIFWVTFAVTAPLFLNEDGDGPFPMDTPVGTTLTFAAFGIVLVLFHALAVWVHQRGVESMLGPLDACWRDFKASLKWVGGLAAVISIASLVGTDPDQIEIRPIPTWVFFGVLGGFFIIIQSMTEEVIYRGYLTQQLAVYRPQRWVWVWIPSLIFGVSHYFNGYGPADGLVNVIWATCLGLACVDLTERTGNIGAAIGLHAANNLYATLFIGIEGWPNSGLALFLVEYFDPLVFDYSLPTFFDPVNLFQLLYALFILWMMWMAARIAIRA